jgi:hypothetical protein
MLMVDYTPCEHKLLITHVEKGVEITCSKCKVFTVYTSMDDVARIVGIFKR